MIGTVRDCTGRNQSKQNILIGRRGMIDKTVINGVPSAVYHGFIGAFDPLSGSIIVVIEICVIVIILGIERGRNNQILFGNGGRFIGKR